ncbi:serine/arginine repetitive matrix protein 1-like [Triticum urartu]|uniref:serine/arginine repetitive matrix protein 1-like n=1 Tax=Triticum urartu TaxID=4572 RepID=UPI00204382CD|nr:serine/arginine repetitive matrix protein 1-like [Triticum urartu]XP_048556844.1 serine/arginine repetitive matrix protein 1-like [Triticum urartu]XP_048556845.1 serine/arginine repetitive matrix protein 1-like [Triticum urartu]
MAFACHRFMALAHLLSADIDAATTSSRTPESSRKRKEKHPCPDPLPQLSRNLSSPERLIPPPPSDPAAAHALPGTRCRARPRWNPRRREPPAVVRPPRTPRRSPPSPDPRATVPPPGSNRQREPLRDPPPSCGRRQMPRCRRTPSSFGQPRTVRAPPCLLAPVSSCHALAGSLCRRKKFKCHSSGRTDLIHGAPSHKVAVARRGIKLASAATNPTTVGEERRNASMIGLGYPSQGEDA